MSKLRLFKQHTRTLVNFQNSFVLPQRFKGTIIEKWAGYWKSLYADYRGMVVDVIVETQEKPKKALAILSTVGLVWQLSKNNPNEIDFREDFLKYANELLLLGDTCRNPKTEQHLKYVEDCHNQGLLRVTNLGIASFLWVDDYDNMCDLYKVNCEYMQPSYLSITRRIVDFGFMGRWWNIFIKFQDFDVNV